MFKNSAVQMVRVRCVYLSAGCEARSQCISSSRLSNRVVYASHSELIVADADRVASCLETCSERRHLKPVTCVKRIHSPSVVHTELFVSGGADGRINLWNLCGSRLQHVKLLDVFATSVSAACGWLQNDGKLCVAASSMGEIRLWKMNYVEGSVSSVNLEVVEERAKHFVLSLDMQRLTTETHEDALILCAGTSKRWVDIYTGVISDSKMEKSLTLKDAHDDWVHALEFDENEDEPILASSGQDSIVKLWRFERIWKSSDGEEEEDVVKRLEVKRIKVDIRDRQKATTVASLLVHIHAVLSGHEDWVHAVHWHPKAGTSGVRQLVTASSDKAVVVWTRMESGVWADSTRLGIIGGQATGFYGAVVCADGETIVASSYYGGLHAWRRLEGEMWEARPLGGGHCGRVSDVVWSRGGSYLLSTSSDNTTRMHSIYGKMRECESGWSESTDGVSSLSVSIPSFVEIGRPQVHGHEIECIATLGEGVFVSGADEKILRVFEIPRTVAESLRAIAGEESIDIEGLGSMEDLPWGASVPALGLSNTAVEKGKGTMKEEGQGEERHWEEEAFVSLPQVLTVPPTEEFLQQNTLWPETHKLYGHGFELFAVAAHPHCKSVVSASRASQASHAAMLQWTPPEYTEAPHIIPGHALTVTQCEFSPDGKWLLSVSRDRTVIVYGRSPEDGTWSSLYQSASKGGPHSRIIWSCAWLDDSTHFITVSREGKVIVWNWDGHTATVLSVYSTKQSVTAVGVGKKNGGRLSDHVVVIGFESGALDVLTIDEGPSVTLLRNRSLIGVPEGEESAEEHNITRIRFCSRSKMDSSLLVGVSTANKKLFVFELTDELESAV